MQKSASMPPNANQDTTESLWDPTLGVPRPPPGPANPNLAVFSRFGGKFGWENCPTVRGTVLRGPQNCFTGVPVSKKVLQWLLNHTKTPHNHYGTLPGGPHGTLGPAKSKKSQISPVSGPRKKHKSPGPPKRPKTQKNRNSAKMRPFHRNFSSWTPPPMCSG